MRYLDAEINRLIAQTKSPVFHNVLMDLLDLRKLAREVVSLHGFSDRAMNSHAFNSLKAHLEAKP